MLACARSSTEPHSALPGPLIRVHVALGWGGLGSVLALGREGLGMAVWGWGALVMWDWGDSGCKGTQGLMWEEGTGADLLFLVREMAPAMLAWRPGVAEKAAGRHRPWRWP